MTWIISRWEHAYWIGMVIGWLAGGAFWWEIGYRRGLEWTANLLSQHNMASGYGAKNND